MTEKAAVFINWLTITITAAHGTFSGPSPSVLRFSPGSMAEQKEERLFTPCVVLPCTSSGRSQSAIDQPSHH